MTNCPTEDILLDYISGSLSPAEMALFQRHADECSRCEALAAAQASVWRSLDEWKPAPVSAGFNRELWRRIDAEAQSSWSWAGIWKQLTPLAVAMALIATAFVFDHQSQRPAASPAAVVVTAGEADQLERTLDDIQLLNAVDGAPPAAKPASSVM